MDEITCSLGDFQYAKRNRQWVRAIFFQELRPRGVDIYSFLDSLIRVKGLTTEILGVLDNPGAYFFKVLRDKWDLNTTSPP